MNFDLADTHNPENPGPSGLTEWCYDLEDLPLRMDESRSAQLIQQMVPALREHEVSQRGITRRELGELRATVEHASGKKDIERFLKAHPHLLTHPLEGEYRWCIPGKNLKGSEDAPDFLLAEMGFLGLEWYGIELESPHTKPFTKKGSPSATLSHALLRTSNWRNWLKANMEYARRPLAGGGLNLVDIRAQTPYYIFIGRRKDLDDLKRESRRKLNRDLNVNICTYDWLLRLLGN